MIIANYGHRLPSNYDINLIRERARERGKLWDSTPRLLFKAFLLRESGALGATANHYSSLYLWQDDAGFRDFLVSGAYKTVTDSFGRADIATAFALDARKGAAREARFLHKEEIAVPVDSELTELIAAEIERNRLLAGKATTVAATVGLDPLNWKLTRVLVSSELPAPTAQGIAFEVLHFARPLLETLPGADL
ncbi:DUF4865 family protein [Brucella haematophila]|uniref:DUF4865 family protein n=1 Tax=Brucella haematophila TaxID=419474 RepID=UPI00110F34CD|nr:DUF4865 family protein [Brucella haematophila]TMV00756.1 DUF4865 family protein [Brucella haematophila]